MKRSTVKFLILALFIAGAFAAFRFLSFSEYLDPEALRVWIRRFGVWGPVVYVVVYIVSAGLMFPGLPITVAGGVLFGPFWGVVYVAIGATLGAGLAFLIARYMGRDWVAGMLKTERLRELDSAVEKQGWKIVAFTRLIPIFPYNLLNYAFGLTRIRFAPYLIATLIFMMPGIVAYVVLSSSILDLFRGRVSPAFVIGAALVVIVSILPLIYRKYRPH